MQTIAFNNVGLRGQLEGQEMKYSLATILSSGRSVPVIELSGTHYSIATASPDLAPKLGLRGLVALFDDWEVSKLRLASLVDEIRRNPGMFGDAICRVTQYLAPLQYPNKVLMFGANYYDHLHNDADMPSFRKEDFIPTMFVKTPSTTLVGSGKSVRYPIQSSKLDWEIELVVVVSKGGRRIPEEEAMDFVAGYSVGIDLSARDWQLHPRHVKNFDLFGGKTFDDSAPMGPSVTPAEFVDYQNLGLELWVNGELKQNANTRDMIWKVPEIIAEMSKHVTLEAGDVLFTGTPAGVGMATGAYLKSGDLLTAEISGLGRLEVEIVDDTGRSIPKVASMIPQAN